MRYQMRLIFWKGVLLLCILSTFGLSCFARKFRTTVSINNNLSLHKYDKKINEGKFDFDKTSYNIAIGLSQKYYLQDYLFISSGLRFNHYQMKQNAINQITEIKDNTYPFSWTHSFIGLSVPMHIGMDYRIKNKIKANVFLGYSIGFFKKYNIKYEHNLPKLHDFGNELIVYKIATSTFWDKDVWVSNFEFGNNFFPFVKYPKIYLGLFASFQLDYGFFTNDVAEIIIPSRNYYYIYDAHLATKMYNISICVGYDF